MLDIGRDVLIESPLSSGNSLTANIEQQHRAIHVIKACESMKSRIKPCFRDARHSEVYIRVLGLTQIINPHPLDQPQVLSRYLEMSTFKLKLCFRAY